MFLTFNHSNLDKEWQFSKFFDVLLNFIITPALLIYTVILYIYFIKVAVVWSLPKGLISVMVFIFTSVAILVKAWQPLLQKRYYDWFFDLFSLISLPALIMFWVSALYRIGQYGLTQMRIYLLLAGVVMTLAIVLFICKKKGSYITVELAAIGLLVLFTYLPFMSAKTLALKDQHSRAERIATKLDMLDADGKFKPREELPSYDSIHNDDYERLYEAMSYINYTEYNDFGMESVYELRDWYPYQQTHR